MQNNKTTFVRFIKNHDIQIPLIQRDYVQGRITDKKSEEKRNNFIRVLFNALLNGTTPCSLDFIYGAEEDYGTGNTQANSPFLPLDGQQRLTTLFLLHWLLLQKAKPIDESEENHSEAVENFKSRIQLLSKFSYKTRISSGRFCQKLTQTEFTPQESLMEQIRTKYWYDDDMQSDLTVQAMMEMLRGMEEILNSKAYQQHWKEMADNAFDEQKNCITFDMLDMKKYHLTDGLYVKMNARGKELTEFENWKANFISFLQSNPKQEERFSYSIEHEWNDLFWFGAYHAYKENVDQKDDTEEDTKQITYPRIDEHFMNFFDNILRLLFFINKDEDSKADDYKIGLWSTAEDVFCNPKMQDKFFDILDTLSLIMQGNTAHYSDGTEKFFDDLFYDKPSSEWKDQTSKVKLFDQTKINLFKETYESNSFSWTHILLYAILMYCHQFQQYTVDEDLCNYVRICANYLYEHNYLDRANVQISPQVRANDMNNYYRVFSYLLTDKNPFNSLRKPFKGKEKEYITNEQNKLCYYSNPEILKLSRKLEDMSYTHGNLSAFYPVLRKCFENTNYCEIIWNAMLAFKNASPIQKSQTFVALNYHGLYIKNCAYGACVFIGCESRNRWEVHFRTKPQSNENPQWITKISDWVDQYVSAYQKYGDINAIIDGQKITSPSTTKDYMLKYPDVISAQVHWRNTEDTPFYFAMKDPWKDLDMIVIHSFSSRPLGNSYQICPMVNAVINRLGSITEHYIQEYRIGYIGRGASKGGIIISKNSEDWEDQLFLLTFGKHHWHSQKEYLMDLPQEIQNQFSIDSNGDATLNITKEMDLIETASDVMRKVIDYFRSRHLL